MLLNEEDDCFHKYKIISWKCKKLVKLLYLTTIRIFRMIKVMIKEGKWLYNVLKYCEYLGTRMKNQPIFLNFIFKISFKYTTWRWQNKFVSN